MALLDTNGRRLDPSRNLANCRSQPVLGCIGGVVIKQMILRLLEVLEALQNNQYERRSGAMPACEAGRSNQLS